MLATQLRDLGYSMRQSRVGVIQLARESPVGGGVFMGTTDLQGSRQGRQAIKRCEHLPGSAFEQASAAETEQRIAAEQHTCADEGDMTEGVAGNRDHLEARRRRAQFERVTVVEALVGLFDTKVMRCVYLGVMLLAQRGDATDMVLVVMSEKNGPQGQLALCQRAFHRLGIAGVDHQRVACIVVQQPDVVIDEGRERYEMHVVLRVLAWPPKGILRRSTGSPTIASHPRRLVSPALTEGGPMWLPVSLPSRYTLQVPDRMHRMSAASFDIYASAPLQRLLDDEARELLPELQRCCGDHGLLLSAAGLERPPALPMLSCWTRMRLAGDRYAGDVVGRTDEPLPFGDDSFELVILRHALETAALPQSLLEEAMRVLSPGGLLVLSGVHPLSLWTPWLAWRARGQSLRLRMPLQVGEWLRRGAMQVQSVRRVGHALPGGEGISQLTEAIGGGYVLLARKRRRSVTPIRLVPRGLRAPADASLAPGARRNVAGSGLT